MRAIPSQSQSLRTHSRGEMIDVTDLVGKLAAEKGVRDGFAIVYVPHTTAAITINENADSDVQHDILAKLQALIPKSEPYYQHGEGNSDSHIKTSLVGQSVTVLIEGGRLVLGRWQGIFFCEFDGPRQRDLIVKLIDLESAGGD